MNNKDGFTLFELLLVISLGIILILIAVPSYQHLLARNKTVGIIDQIITGIHLARAEAVANGEVVVFCGTKDNIHCDGDWQAGQLNLLESSQKVLQVFPRIPAGDYLSWKSSLGYNNVLKLAPNGFTDGQRGSFYYCPAVKPKVYGAKIVVSDSGRVRVETDRRTLEEICA